MRAFYLVGFAGAAIVGAGALAFGCSSSSDNTTPTPDASTVDTGVTTDDGGDSGTTPCTPIPISVATFDAGATFACTQAKCQTELTACAAECLCNDAVLAALACTADAGPASAQICFTGPLTDALSGGSTAVGTLAGCLQSAAGMCGITIVTDAGTDGGPKSDAGTSDAGTPDAATPDAAAKADGGDAG